MGDKQQQLEVESEGKAQLKKYRQGREFKTLLGEKPSDLTGKGGKKTKGHESIEAKGLLGWLPHQILN